MGFFNYKFKAFTLSEVLITLAIIGVVAAITLPTLITKINNKGYAERFIKTYSILQDVTNQIVNEKGDPQTWPWTQYQGSDMNSSGNKEIAQYYKDKLKIGIDCCDDNRNGSTAETACYIPSTQYKYLNGNLVTLYRPFGTKYVFTLNDGVTIGIDFNQTRTGVMWGYTSLVFTIDVNGKRGPNQVGRDLFYLYLDKNKKGKIQTYVESYNSVDRFNRDNCKSGMSGYSCGEKIITEGGMFY